MAIFKQGVNYSPTKNTPTTQNSSTQKIIAGRVTDIVLSSNHPRYNDVKKRIGTIFYETVPISNDPSIPSSLPFAFPLNSHTITYPLVDEIVCLIQNPFDLNEGDGNKCFYYISTVNLWNTPNHNAYPEVNGNNSKTFIKAQLNSPTDSTQEEFIEQSNIRGLLPQMGDVLMQGRNGQSIRFSNNKGNPLIYIRNGQNKTLQDGFGNIEESIRNDGSSIYLASSQQLKDFNVAGNENYSAFPKNSQPIFPSQYTSHQIAINSNRIVINAKEDSILLSAKKLLSISIDGNTDEKTGEIIGGVGITTPSFYIGSNTIRLGGNDAKEPILKGNTTVSLLKSLVESVEKLAQILEVEKNWPKGALVTSNNTVATNARSTLQDLLKQLDLDESKSDSLKSYTSKVK